MKRIELACCALLASAFVLGGLLLVQLDRHGGFASRADADMVITRGNLTIMTARTKSNEEALFILENVSERLLIFTLDLPKKRLQLAVPPVVLSQLFATAPSPGAAPSTPRRTPR